MFRPSDDGTFGPMNVIQFAERDPQLQGRPRSCAIPSSWSCRPDAALVPRGTPYSSYSSSLLGFPRGTTVARNLESLLLPPYY